MKGGARVGSGAKRKPGRRLPSGALAREQKTALCACGNLKTQLGKCCQACYDIARAKKPILCACGQRRSWGTERCAVCVRKAFSQASLRTCVGCGIEFIRKHTGNRGLYCSRACAFKHHAVGGQNKGRILVAKFSPISFINCAECLALFVKRSKSNRRTCSDECRLRFVTRMSRAQIAQKRAVLYPLKSVQLVCQNKNCKKAFLHTYRRGAGDKRFCSIRCMKRECRRGRNHHESRARRAGVLCQHGIDPLKVFARDGWRCQLCGCSTPKRLRGTTDDRAPELDHIIPLSVGGGHTWDNVQCACKRCNSAKGSKPLGQLRLAV